MTAGGEGGARARPFPSSSAAGTELVLAGKARSTSRAWRAERWARTVPDLGAWGLTRSADHFLGPPGPSRHLPLSQGAPQPVLGAVSCSLPDVPPWRAASLGRRVADETIYSARAGPEARAL